MTDIPTDLYYTKSHEWVRQEDKDTVSVGISDYAQHAMGDIVFLELPEVGRMVGAGEEVGVIESVKSAADIYTPLSGEIIEVNDAMLTEPAQLNRTPYQWLFKVRLQDSEALQTLLRADDYMAICEE